ncbi:uncharacterized protein LOC117541052 [Gymnodraco acuticeps]|uniref:Uncharacterized protein LOC117541052 n=2 Tax=Notothenioidei TaxID=8205 RepID=A0A6P8TJ07_GYMAC|nr:uncharacterized protein LOC117541052 [Gymnodraco acuticeps]
MVSSRSGDEENAPESLKKSKLSTHKHCYMYITSVKHEKVDYLTNTRWNTYRTSLQRWLGLKGDSRNVVAENHKHCLDFEFEDIPEDAGFHHTCYRRFTDKKAMTKVERRLAREGDQDVREDLEVEPIPSTSSSTYRSQTEKLRSRSGLPIAGSGPVLPALCIICKMKEKMIIKAGKRQRDQLCKTETLSAGKLQKAAEKKDDQSVLLHIKDKDCVALEVRYHKSCYSQYIKFLLRPDKPETEQDEPMFDASYKLFCERIIRQRLLVNNEVLRMGQLRKAFIDMVKANEGVDASNYSSNVYHP